MTSLLIKLFIKDYDNIKDAHVRSSYGKLSGLVGIVLNIILSAVKFFTGTLTGSVSITADAVNNLSDAGSSIINLAGFKISEKPADKQHPYGHGRVEYISALIVSFLVLLMGVELMKTSVDKIRNPEPVVYSTAALIILILSICGKLWLAFFNSKLSKKIESTATKAVVVDSLSDTLATGVALASLIISKYSSANVDGYFGIVVALFILSTGISIIKETISPLLGQPPTKEFFDEISNKILSYDGVIGVHDLIIHDYGPNRLFASAHAEVPSNIDIMKSHDTIDLIERDIKKQYGILMSIHLDPIIVDDERINELKQITKQAVGEIYPDVTIHDFRVVDGVTHTNLIFDVLTQDTVKCSDQEMVSNICKKLSKIDERYFCVITIDHSFN